VNIDIIERVVIDAIADVSGISVVGIGMEDSLRDLELDSLECICLVAAVEDALQIEVSCCDRIGFETVGDVVRMADAAVKGRREVRPEIKLAA
jgi:acyl carrier protein